MFVAKLKPPARRSSGGETHPRLLPLGPRPQGNPKKRSINRMLLLRFLVFTAVNLQH